jgi:hypothetical protein
LNLLCAEGLTGSDGVDLGAMLGTLDAWAKRVDEETHRHFYRYVQQPEEFNGSVGYFRVLMMVTILQQDHGVRYNPARIEASIPDDVFFADSRDLFLHGILGERRMGTCVSMPVLYVAVGRRLGYPMKLVQTKGHVFARWESADGKERFNIEGTNQGLNCFPDEHYRQWPVPSSQAEVVANRYLESMSTAEELALFLATRGHCLQAARKHAEANEMYRMAERMAPGVAVYRYYGSNTSGTGTRQVGNRDENWKDDGSGWMMTAVEDRNRKGKGAVSQTSISHGAGPPPRNGAAIHGK